MRVLIVKTSSLGDVVHALPAVTDALAALPGIRFDWVVEEAFQSIPAWHPAVDEVIPVAIRRWRRHPFGAMGSGEWRRFRTRLRAQRYDRVVDAQGLLKSALVARFARGPHCGWGARSAREAAAALFYERRYHAAWEQHAVTRVRRLLAGCLGYAAPDTLPDYGLDRGRFERPATKPYLLFLHGTTWPSKEWPESHWRELAEYAGGSGHEVRLPWGNDDELARAERLAADLSNVTVLPRLSFEELAVEMVGSRCVVGVDTGLAHLAAALAVPGVTLYGATQPERTGTYGAGQRHLQADFPCSPCLSRQCRYRGPAAVTPACYATLPPAAVWAAVRAKLPDPSRQPRPDRQGVDRP